MDRRDESDSVTIAQKFCRDRGEDWRVVRQLGRGGTAPVFLLETPNGQRAFKLYDVRFSVGERADIERKRVEQQVSLGEHDCPHLIKTYEGGLFAERLYILMDVAPGKELEKRLHEVPRDRIRTIIHQVATACIYLRRHELTHRDIKSANVFISDDFSHATLLDLSVMRDIHDPIGLGTDHGNQLPVVATSRYSPPEYLFRLLDPGPALWHAVDIYQLGGLLHDLVMRQPLFSEEYACSKDNRYRFAWVVAVKLPIIEALDVDNDLKFLARRALDKDWVRRSQLSLEDFLNRPSSRADNALALLGLGRASLTANAVSRTEFRRRAAEIADALDARMIAYFKRLGRTVSHPIAAGSHDAEKILRFQWNSDHSRGC